MRSKRSPFPAILIALALLARVLAPFAAYAQTFDPLTDAPICSHAGGASEAIDAKEGGKGGSKSEHAACDALCCHLAQAIDAPTSASAILERIALGISQAPALSPNVASRERNAFRARGPPKVS